MKNVNVGLVGFGTVGSGVVRTLLGKHRLIEKRSGVSVRLVKIADKNIKSRPGIRLPGGILTRNTDDVINDKKIDIVIELIGGIHPAKEIIIKALTSGKHVVTANKALLAEHGKEIFTAASRFRVNIGFEGSVGGGIPIISALQNSLVGNEIELISGILNGTSNFILSKMTDDNCSFAEALREARQRGIAEKNPKLDVMGFDSRHKLAILTLLGFGVSVKPENIYVEGIEDIDPLDIQYAGNWGYTVKLLAIAKKSGNGLELRVHPTLIPSRDILASVKDENNAIFVKGDMVGETLFYGRGAGSLPAASSVIGDVVEISKMIKSLRKPLFPIQMGANSGVKKICGMNNLATRYYVRFSAIDKPGVLAGVSGVLAKNGISIATVTQKERKKGQPVPIVMLTHEANEGWMNKALAVIDKMPFIKKKSVKIRMEI
ncbi:MAG: homoserine dehydrogenase [Candidatus Omnitrophica bacterium]|nr:homoserine dehydrogenase [Candidatus Omnitrophota bacterium]